MWMGVNELASNEPVEAAKYLDRAADLAPTDVDALVSPRPGTSAGLEAELPANGQGRSRRDARARGAGAVFCGVRPDRTGHQRIQDCHSNGAQGAWLA